MPTDRAGYNLTVFALDVSASMGEQVAMGDEGVKRSKLDLAREYIARSCEPRISSGRKTEAVGLLSFGGRTNNQANQAARKQEPGDDDPPYECIACDVAVQTVRPKTLEVLMNLEQGKEEGNPVSALMVALDMISQHKHTKSWSLEVILITDGESAFVQDEYEDLITRFEDYGVKLTVLGIGFTPLGETVDKSKTRNKRLSEKFWRTFIELLHDRFSGVNASDDFLPTLQVFDDALVAARIPQPEHKNGTVSNIDIFIGSAEIDQEQAVKIPVKYSKATMKARPPTLSRAWRPAMDLQAPLHPNAQRPYQTQQSQLLSSYVDQQSQQHGQSQGGGDGQGGSKIPHSDIAGLISSEVKGYSTYVVKKEPVAPPGATQETGMDGSQMSGSQVPGTQNRTQGDAEEREEEEEEVVAKEDLVKAWRFGSTWVPMEADTFEPLATRKGVEVLGFFPRANLKRHHLMGEVRFIWPDLTDPQAQIKFSSFVAGMVLREMVAVVRWVLKDQAEPVIGVCIPEQDFPGDDKRLDFMFWVRLPFAEDEHNFWFPSLTTYKTSAGKVLKEHPLLPTDEQCDLMESFVQAMDLDAFAEVNGDDDEPGEPWFDTVNSYNPAIHRIKEAIFHASLTRDLDQDPLGPPHPEIVKYLDPPIPLVDKSEKIVQQLKEALDIKKVPAKVRMQKRAKEGLRDDEGYIDIDALFDDDGADDGVAPYEGKGKAKAEPTTPSKLKISDSQAGNGGSVKDEPDRTPVKHKPKRGRIISNEAPLDDFNRLISGEGDVFRKAIQDLGAVVKENVESSFSRQAFPLAIECLQAMRKTALVYEEVDTYNTFLEEFEGYIKAPQFKHKDFWQAAEEAGDAVRAITEEEEEAALQD